MKMREITPWRWGGLRHWHRDKEPVGGFRQQMESLHSEMDRLFEEMLNDPWSGSLFAQPAHREMVMPDIDEIEDDKAFHVTVELPGMDEKDVDITLTDRRLTIRGKKKQETEEKDKDYYRRERNYGAFRRTIELPGDVDESKIEASFKKGVLSIELPKSAEAQEKVKHISVEAA